MQHIQDNEFDQLFKERFEEAEVTPSANLWSNIETQLAEKPKRVFPVYWLAAAISLAAVSVGLMFYKGGNNRERGTHLTASEVTVAPKVSKGILASAAGPAIEEPSVTANIRQSGISPKLSQHLYRSHEIEEISDATDESASTVIADPKKHLAGLQPMALNAHLYTKEVVVKQEKLTLPVSAPSQAEEVVLANATADPAGSDEVINENESRTENKGIRNVGDLINYVVDKVDKREEKIIQFKTEDDNSSIVALNIGMFKFNQRKHK
jgi:hypothetical protein